MPTLPAPTPPDTSGTVEFVTGIARICPENMVGKKLFWLGADFGGRPASNLPVETCTLASQVNPAIINDHTVSVTYGDCSPPSEDDGKVCPLPLEVQTTLKAEKHWSLYSEDGQPYPWAVFNLSNPWLTTTSEASASYDNGTTIEIYIGGTTILITGDDPTEVANAANSVRPLPASAQCVIRVGLISACPASGSDATDAITDTPGTYPDGTSYLVTQSMIDAVAQIDSRVGLSPFQYPDTPAVISSRRHRRARARLPRNLLGFARAFERSTARLGPRAKPNVPIRCRASRCAEGLRVTTPAGKFVCRWEIWEHVAARKLRLLSSPPVCKKEVSPDHA